MYKDVAISLQEMSPDPNPLLSLLDLIIKVLVHVSKYDCKFLQVHKCSGLP